MFSPICSPDFSWITGVLHREQHPRCFLNHPASKHRETWPGEMLFFCKEICPFVGLEAPCFMYFNDFKCIIWEYLRCFFNAEFSSSDLEHCWVKAGGHPDASTEAIDCWSLPIYRNSQRFGMVWLCDWWLRLTAGCQISWCRQGKIRSLSWFRSFFSLATLNHFNLAFFDQGLSLSLRSGAEHHALSVHCEDGWFIRTQVYVCICGRFVHVLIDSHNLCMLLRPSTLCVYIRQSKCLPWNIVSSRHCDASSRTMKLRHTWSFWLVDARDVCTFLIHILTPIELQRFAHVKIEVLIRTLGANSASLRTAARLWTHVSIAIHIYSIWMYMVDMDMDLDILSNYVRLLYKMLNLFA